MASPVTIVLTLRRSQSSLKLNPARSYLRRRVCISSRACGHSAQILARARSPLDSLVPPLLTRLKMSTTPSTVLSSPVTSSMWRPMSLMLLRALRRLM
jgi:hypothetical protein